MFFHWFSKNHVINITKDSNVHFIVLFCDRFERDNMMSKLSGQLDFRVSKINITSLLKNILLTQLKGSLLILICREKIECHVTFHDIVDTKCPL